MRSLLTLRLLLLPLWGLLMALAVGTSHAQGLPGGSVYQSEQSRAELVLHAPQGLQPGAPVWAGLRLDHAPDWHSYWQNPGDSGLPTELQWILPEGLAAGAIQWPTPRKFPLGDLANYGYDGTVLLPVPLTVAPSLPDGSVLLQVRASWLICRQECIPEEAELSLRVSRTASLVGHAGLFQSAWDAAPPQRPAGSSRLQVRDQALQLDLSDLPAPWRGQPLAFFPETPGLIVPGAPWQQTWAGTRWQASVPLSPDRVDSPAELALVVAPANAPGKGPGLAGVRLTLPVDGGWPAPTAVPASVSPALAAALQAAANAPPPAPATGEGLGIWLALGGALIGGLILNLMPCVFPVLAIKVMAFAHQGDNHRAHRAGGLAYTAGVVLSFMALGGLLLALRAAGEQLGWGFQLQNPAVVAGLAVLFTLIGLNLAGLFEFGHLLPSRLASLQLRNPSADAFLTGVLAGAIASPCTAPFMGASLGLAVALPAGQALAVFATLGLGMALPYLAASWIPALARALPRPGAWMVTFRQLMAFPMLATVVWLLWVLGQQSGIDGVAALLMWLVVMGWLVWALGRQGRTRTVMTVLAALCLAWLSWALGPYVTRLAEPAALETSAGPAQDGQWMGWSPQRQAALLAEGRPVLVDFTAAWCVTCQYNKRTALASDAFLQAADQQRVALMRADWTRRDPQVTQALASLGRNGVPVYAYYRPGQAPELLPEILSTEALLQALNRP